MTHLRLVPPSGGEPPRRRGGRHAAALSLTEDEVRHLRAAVKGIARSYGGKAGLARALGLGNPTLRKRRLSAALAVALWRLTGIGLDVLLRGKLAAVPTPPDDGPRAA
jgi:hypothetical protein